MLEQQLQQKLQQKQTLSPLQIQQIRLIELPLLEMEERIKQELEENPALEEGVELEAAEEEAVTADDDSPEDTAEDIELGDYLTEDDIPDYRLHQMQEHKEMRQEIPFSGGQSLHEYLIRQLGLRHLTEQERKMGEYIIGSLEDDGYLRREPAAIADDYAFQTGETVPEADITRLLGIIQDFDPPGIAARDLRECLLLQLRRKTQNPAIYLAIHLLKFYYDDFVHRRYNKLIHVSNDELTLRQAVHEVTLLNPKPGNDWENALDSARNIVVPDFIVETHDGEIVLSMNGHGMPDLRINREYAALFRNEGEGSQATLRRSAEAMRFVKQKVGDARWFIDAVRQRQQTLRQTMQAIILYQHDFFLWGDETSLRPMILKDIADISGYDISTVSRVSNSKYVQTPFGVYPLKFFFSEGLATDSGEEVSSREIKQIITRRIAAEDKRKPLTDDRLTAILQQEGYNVARRTVAKYRQQLDIPVAGLRREL